MYCVSVVKNRAYTYLPHGYRERRLMDHISGPIALFEHSIGPPCCRIWRTSWSALRIASRTSVLKG